MAETTLYNGSGIPVAYIADDKEHSIYLWSGHAVAYINGENVYGWNGQHLGWFVNGIIYNLQGLKLGFIKKRCPVITYVQPAKYTKFAKFAKYARYAPFARPIFSVSYLQDGLDEFLRMGTIQ